MAQDKVLIRRSGHQQLDELDATDIPALSYAPNSVPYLVTTADAGLSAEVVVPAAVLTVLDDTTVGAMVDTLGGASSTGTGGLVRATSPVLVTPALGTPASGVATNLTGTALGLTTPAIPPLPLRAGGTFFYAPRLANAATQTLVQGTLYAAPFWVPATTTFIGIAVAVVGVASTTCQLGIYNDGSGVPTTLVLDAGNIATATNGTKTITISQALTGGKWYWLACGALGGAPSVVGTSATYSSADLVPSTAPFSGNNNGYSQTGLTGALPSPWGATLTLNPKMPSVYLLVQ